MSHIANLNSDVLNCILQECPTSSLFVLSLVSTSIHALALPHLLHSVYLGRSPTQVLSFLSLIIDNTHSIGRHVLHLELDGSAFETDSDGERPLVSAEIEEDPILLWAPAFARALAFMPNILSLSLQNKVEEIASHSSDFASAILSLPRLHSVCLTSIGHVASNQFRRLVDLKSDFTSLQVIDIVPHWDIKRLHLTKDEGMGKVLFGTRRHLTQIGLLRCELRDFLGEKTFNHTFHDEGDTQTTFPRVVKLSLDSCDTYLEDIAIAFPMLHILDLGFLPFLRDPINAPTRTFCSFPSLVSVTGRQWDVYSVLKCNNDRGHIRRLRFTHPWNDDDDIPLSTFAVPAAAPFLKSFSSPLGSVQPLPWWQAFSKSVPHLVYLCVSLCVRTTEELDLLLVQIPQTLASIPSLEYISIVVEGFDHVMGNCTSPEIQASTTEQAVALSYAKNIPALKYIDVARNVPLEIRGSPTWWRVVRQVFGAENDFAVNVKPLDTNQGISKKGWYDRAAWGI